jgi:hypothetical protein
MALLSVDKKVRYPDDQLEKTATNAEVDCPACEGTGFPPVKQPIQLGRRIAALERAQCRVPSGWHAAVSITVREGGEVVAQVPNCLAFPPRLAQPRLGRGNHKMRNLGIGALHRAGWLCVRFF